MNTKTKFPKFSIAHKIVLAKKFETIDEYRKWLKNTNQNLPYHPDRTYKNKGWVSTAHWIGFVNPFNPHNQRDKLSYQDASDLVQNLKIRSGSEYNAWYKKNKLSNMPSSPEQYYKNSGWISRGHFFGTGRIADQYKKDIYLFYQDAESYVKSLGINSMTEYHKWWDKNKPNNISRYPDSYYKDKGWISWSIFLGNSTRLLTNEEIVTFLHQNAGKLSTEDISKSLNISQGIITTLASQNKISLKFKYSNTNEYEIKYIRENAGKLSTKEIAANLKINESRVVYIATINKISLVFFKKFFTEEELNFIRVNANKMSTKDIAKALNTKKNTIHTVANKNKIKLSFLVKKEYDEFEINFVRENSEKMSTKDIANFLGRSVFGVKNLAFKYKIKLIYNKGKNFLPFEEAREYVRKLNLNSDVEYREWHNTNKPKFLPKHPNIYYKLN